jgi:hypothetical protein
MVIARGLAQLCRRRHMALAPSRQNENDVWVIVAAIIRSSPPNEGTVSRASPYRTNSPDYEAKHRNVYHDDNWPDGKRILPAHTQSGTAGRRRAKVAGGEERLSSQGVPAGARALGLARKDQSNSRRTKNGRLGSMYSTGGWNRESTELAFSLRKASSSLAIRSATSSARRSQRVA